MIIPRAEMEAILACDDFELVKSELDIVFNSSKAGANLMERAQGQIRRPCEVDGRA